MRCITLILLVCGLLLGCTRVPEPTLHDWPTEEDLYWHGNKAVREIVSARFEQASREPLVSPVEVAQVKAAVLADLPNWACKPNSVNNVRWLSTEEVMVQAAWLDFPPAMKHALGQEIRFVLQRKGDNWVIIRRYVIRNFE